MDLNRLLSEIQRRRVARVAGVYAVAGWVIVQVVATVFPLLGVADWAAKMLVVLVLIGFPIAVALGWAYDLTKDGLRRTQALPAEAAVVTGDAASYRRALGFFGVGILVAFVAFAAFSRVRSEHSPVGIQSIAVLPFVDLSEKQDQRYFTDGVSEELLNRLAQIPNLRVPARTSSFSYRGQNVSIEEIGRRLRVEAVLEGSVRREGNNVRVTAKLVDAQSEYVLWSNEYEKQLSSVFALQDEIAGDIVKALKLQFDPKSASAPALAGATASPAAVDAYMKGLELWNRRGDRELRRALGYFQEAIEKDGQFALAHALLAQTYALLPTYGDFPAFEASAKGQQAAATALGLNASQPEAHAALGQIRQNFEWDFESAERSYRRALLFNNGYATAHQWRAEALLFLGEWEESRKEIDIALDLAPSSPSALHFKAFQYMTRHEYAAAGRLLESLLAAQPDYPHALASKATIALLTQQWSTAEASLRRLAANDAELTKVFDAVLAAARDPQYRAEAAAALKQLEERHSSSDLAAWYALIGALDLAMEKLSEAYASGADSNLPYALLDPAFDPIRSREEFQDILRELHMSRE